MKKFFSDFKKFIAKGNILDLAVAVIMGAAFGKIITSLVNDLIMPLISLLVGGMSVFDWKWIIKPAEYDAAGVLVTAETALMYGNFIQAIIDFLIIAICIFVLIRIIMRTKKLNKEEIAKLEIEKKAAEDAKKAEEEANRKPSSEELLAEIRDLLKDKK